MVERRDMHEGGCNVLPPSADLSPSLFPPSSNVNKRMLMRTCLLFHMNANAGLYSTEFIGSWKDTVSTDGRRVRLA